MPTSYVTATLPNGSSDQATAVREAFRIFKQSHPTVGIRQILVAIIKPTINLFRLPPSLPESALLVDTVNAEKYRRIRHAMPKDQTFFVHVLHISTPRTRSFVTQLEQNGQRILRFSSASPVLIIRQLQFVAEAWRRDSDRLMWWVFRVMLEMHLLHYRLLIQRTGARSFYTANEDDWIAGPLALLCRQLSVRTINVMHGRVYDNKQFYDTSITFGKRCTAAVAALASEHTTVIQLPLPLSSTHAPDRHEPRESRRRIVHYDQPTFDQYPSHLRHAVLAYLNSLAAAGYSVTIKLHPANDTARMEKKTYGDLQFTRTLSPDELSSRFDIATSVCSTAGLEVVPNGVPIIYFNIGNILRGFSQIAFLAESAVPSLTDATHLLEWLQSTANYNQFVQRQQWLMTEEYSCGQGTMSAAICPGISASYQL